MSLYVLDTDSLSLYQRRHPGLEKRIRALAPGDLALSIISVEEQLTGWYAALRKARNADHLSSLYDRLTATVRFLADLPLLSFSKAAVRRHQELTKQKLNIGKMDLRIAAIALEHRAIVVSRNLRDFKRVPGLPVEDWTS
jgi:tRNA(fMet)-specific endonuclease VapC